MPSRYFLSAGLSSSRDGDGGGELAVADDNVEDNDDIGLDSGFEGSGRGAPGDENGDENRVAEDDGEDEDDDDEEDEDEDEDDDGDDGEDDDPSVDQLTVFRLGLSSFVSGFSVRSDDDDDDDGVRGVKGDDVDEDADGGGNEADVGGVLVALVARASLSVDDSALLSPRPLRADSKARSRRSSMPRCSVCRWAISSA